MTVHLNSENFEKEISKGFVVVDFFAEWCGPCKSFAPIFEEVSKEYKGIKFCKLNVDSSPSISDKFGVRSIPTVIFFKDGKEVERSIGFMSKEELKAKIDALK